MVAVRIPKTATNGRGFTMEIMRMVEDGDGRRIVWEGRYLRGVIWHGWEFVERKNISGIVGIVALTDDDRLVLVEQYRPPVSATVIELPAGLVGDMPGHEAEQLEDAARRELIEETGYNAQRIVRLCNGAISAGICDEHITLLGATGLTKVGPGGGDESEDIIVHEVPMDQLVQWLDHRSREGTVIDLKVYLALGVRDGEMRVLDNQEQ